MSDYTKYTKQEMQAYAIAKKIKENQIVMVGTGLDLMGALVGSGPTSASSALRPTSGCTTLTGSSPSSAAHRSILTAT